MRFKLEGILRTTSPMHITAPGERKTKLPGDTKATAALFPMQAVQRMKLPMVLDEQLSMGANFSVDDARGESAEKRYRAPEVPVIPANGVRGRLRRECARVLFDVFAERGEKISLDTYNTLLCGAATGSIDSAPAGLAEIREAINHPFWGLWGGGPRMMRSGLRVDTCYPICEETKDLVASVFDSGYAAAGSGRDLVQVLWRRRNDDVLSFADPKYAEAMIDDFLVAIEEYQAERGKPKSDDDADDYTRGVRSFTAYEVVSPGVPFRLAFDIDGDLAHLGLFLNGLRRFIHAQSIGGMGRIGYGRFEVLDLYLFDIGSQSPAARVFGDSVVSKPISQRYNFSDNDLVQLALSAWEASKSTLSAGQLERLLKPAPAKKEKAK